MSYKAIFICLFVGLVLSDGVEVFQTKRCGFSSRADCLEHYDDWELIGRAHKEEEHTIVIAVKKPDNAEDQCSSALYKVSTPNSPHYGQYYSLQGLRTLGLFSEKSTRKVEKWLKKYDLRYDVTINGDYIRVYGNVGQFEELLHAEFYNFYSYTADKTIKRTVTYSLDKKIAKHIDFVGHTISFPPVKSMFITPSPLSNGVMDPPTLHSFYQIPTINVTNPLANQSVFEALGQSYSPSDLTQFQQNYNLLQTPVAEVIGPNYPSQCTSDPDNCGEANLDVQYIMAIAQNATTWFWSISNTSQDPFLDWVVAVSNTSNAPLVHSISYGSIATENPEKDMYRFNTDVCQLGLRGITVVVSSGDDGVANFEARNNASACGFNPSFPTTSPYVTGVGATQGPENGQSEIACSSATGGLITTGGGFSIYFSRPSYQAAAVTKYLSNSNNNIPPTSMFNSKGRAYPDVAMAGHNYNIYIGGTAYTVSGTSASAPVFAAVVTLINNARLNAGQPALGFLNPTIYHLGASSSNGVFNDVTQGENNCCAGQGNQVCCQYGFYAAKGWDPLTGFGSVNFPAFESALLNSL